MNEQLRETMRDHDFQSCLEILLEMVNDGYLDEFDIGGKTTCMVHADLSFLLYLCNRSMIKEISLETSIPNP